MLRMQNDLHVLLEDIDPDKAGAIYNKGVMEGMKHTSPSPETASRLSSLEESHKAFDIFRAGIERSFGRMEGKLDSLTTSITDLKGAIVGVQNDFATMEKGRLTRLEVNFATLQTETAYRAKTAAIITGIITSVLSSVVAGTILYAIAH